MTSRKLILDLGSGKYNPQLINLYKDSSIVIHVDRCFTGLNISQNFDYIMNSIMSDCFTDETDIFCGCDVFDFLDNFPFKGFSKVVSNRFFEHLEYCGGEIGRVLEACNNITLSTGELEIVVPNAKILSTKLLDCESMCRYSDNDVMILNTEYCNGKFDPHGSIWTPVLARKYIEQENTWKITKIIDRFPFAGRDIYMKIFCSKPQETQYEPSIDCK